MSRPFAPIRHVTRSEFNMGTAIQSCGPLRMRTGTLMRRFFPSLPDMAFVPPGFDAQLPHGQFPEAAVGRIRRVNPARIVTSDQWGNLLFTTAIPVSQFSHLAERSNWQSYSAFLDRYGYRAPILQLPPCSRARRTGKFCSTTALPPYSNARPPLIGRRKFPPLSLTEGLTMRPLRPSSTDYL